MKFKKDYTYFSIFNTVLKEKNIKMVLDDNLGFVIRYWSFKTPKLMKTKVLGILVENKYKNDV